MKHFKSGKIDKIVQCVIRNSFILWYIETNFEKLIMIHNSWNVYDKTYKYNYALHNYISDDRDCPVQSKVKCNYKYDVPCSTTSDCERRGRRNQICCPDEGGHPVCTPRRPGRCPYVKTRHCRASNIVKTACSNDKDCPLPAKCCLNSQCRNYCEFNPVLGRGYSG